MTTIELVIVAIATLALVWILAARHGYRAGRKEGNKAGYSDGRRDADNWWIGIERDIDQARRQIWKEEAQL